MFSVYGVHRPANAGSASIMNVASDIPMRNTWRLMVRSFMVLLLDLLRGALPDADHDAAGGCARPWPGRHRICNRGDTGAVAGPLNRSGRRPCQERGPHRREPAPRER